METEGSNEITLFGVRIVVDSMRKTVSMNNLADYQRVDASANKAGDNENAAAVASADVFAAGYVSADNAGRNSSVRTRVRKRGNPWSTEEHKRFLQGLERVGKGDWRGISKNFVKTRTPTQVASHAQKYFIRQTTDKRRRRSSLFDITPETVTKAPSQEQPQSTHGDNVSSLPNSQTTNSSNTSFYPMVPVIPFQMPPPLVAPISDAYPTQGQFPGQVTSVPAFNFNYMGHPSPLLLDLSLSLSNYSQKSPNPALQTMPRLMNNQGFISVV